MVHIFTLHDLSGEKKRPLGGWLWQRSWSPSKIRNYTDAHWYLFINLQVLFLSLLYRYIWHLPGQKFNSRLSSFKPDDWSETSQREHLRRPIRMRSWSSCWGMSSNKVVVSSLCLIWAHGSDYVMISERWMMHEPHETHNPCQQLLAVGINYFLFFLRADWLNFSILQ